VLLFTFAIGVPFTAELASDGFWARGFLELKKGRFPQPTKITQVIANNPV
jgi:hypothetical protein